MKTANIVQYHVLPNGSGPVLCDKVVQDGPQHEHQEQEWLQAEGGSGGKNKRCRRIKNKVLQLKCKIFEDKWYTDCNKKEKSFS